MVGRPCPTPGNGRTVAIGRPHRDEPSSPRAQPTLDGVRPLSEPRVWFRCATKYVESVERLAANGLEPRLAGGTLEVARRLCGVQAQDAAAARLAIRARTDGLRAADVDG